MALLAFCCVETTRYPYYILKLLGGENSSIGLIFGHLRYNLFLIFYPMGAFGDLMTGIYACDNMRKEGTLTLKMPNNYNFGFDFPSIMLYVVPLIYLVGFPSNYGLLLSQRKKFYQSLNKVKEA